MHLKRLWVCALATPLWLCACGARTGLHEPSPEAGVEDAGNDVQDVECITDKDCPTADLCSTSSCVEGVCLPAVAVSCDDQDPCTEDSCVPATGECEHRDLALDQDGDGYKGPRPGYAPGAPGSCGDDCDDTNPNAHPGGIEVCDGVDNDCNGIVDDNMTYVPVGAGRRARLGAAQAVRARRRRLQRQDVRGHLRGPGGALARLREGPRSRRARCRWPRRRSPTSTATASPAPSCGPAAIFGTAWEDRRNGNYEIYFNRLDAQGKKLAADLRVTVAGGFSLHPEVIWNGSEFLVAWDDRRQTAPPSTASASASMARSSATTSS